MSNLKIRLIIVLIYVLAFGALILNESDIEGISPIMLGLALVLGGSLGYKTGTVAFLPIRNQISKPTNVYNDGLGSIIGNILNGSTFFGGIIMILVGLNDMI